MFREGFGYDGSHGDRRGTRNRSLILRAGADNEVRYGIHDVESCVSEPRSPRPGESHARLQRRSRMKGLTILLLSPFQEDSLGHPLRGVGPKLRMFTSDNSFVPWHCSIINCWARSTLRALLRMAVPPVLSSTCEVKSVPAHDIRDPKR